MATYTGESANAILSTKVQSAPDASTYQRLLNTLYTRAAGHAAGGTIRTPLALVGERGPELIRAPGYQVTPADQTARMLGGTTINAPLTMYGASEQDIQRVVAQFERIVRDVVGSSPAGNYGMARGAA